jgi:hypothetical protein
MEKQTFSWRRLWLMVHLHLLAGLAYCAWQYAQRMRFSDFSAFYAASSLACAGHPEQVYDVGHLGKLASETVGLAGTWSQAFHYPPTGLLVVVWVGALPYALAIACWGALCLVTWYAVGRTMALEDAAWPWFQASPALLVNLAIGQNGWLTTILVVGAGLSLQRGRPLLAGVAAGCMVFKPHLALAALVALAVVGRWRAIMACAATGLSLVALSLALFGSGAWVAFFRNLGFAHELSLGLGDMLPLMRMPTATAFLSGLGASHGVAVGGQLAVTLAALAAVAWVWTRVSYSGSARMATLCFATIAAAPFAFEYDMAVVGAGAVFAWRNAAASGPSRARKSAVFLAWAWPLLSWVVGGLGLPSLGILVLVVALIVVLR